MQFFTYGVSQGNKLDYDYDEKIAYINFKKPVISEEEQKQIDINIARLKEEKKKKRELGIQMLQFAQEKKKMIDCVNNQN